VEEETFPDIGSISDEELKEPIEMIKGDDVQRLREILAGRSEPPTKPPT
jgi:hypothetical protein